MLKYSITLYAQLGRNTALLGSGRRHLFIASYLSTRSNSSSSSEEIRRKWKSSGHQRIEFLLEDKVFGAEFGRLLDDQVGRASLNKLLPGISQSDGGGQGSPTAHAAIINKKLTIALLMRESNGEPSSKTLVCISFRRLLRTIFKDQSDSKKDPYLKVISSEDKTTMASYLKRLYGKGSVKLQLFLKNQCLSEDARDSVHTDDTYPDVGKLIDPLLDEIDYRRVIFIELSKFNKTAGECHEVFDQFLWFIKNVRYQTEELPAPIAGNDHLSRTYQMMRKRHSADDSEEDEGDDSDLDDEYRARRDNTFVFRDESANKLVIITKFP